MDKLGGLRAPPQGGVNHAGASMKVRGGELPALEVDKVRAACEQLAAGKGAYRAVLYLSHARLDDVPTLFLASRSTDVQERWRLLWVLCPFLTRLVRGAAGRHVVATELQKDMAALQLFVKFVDADNIAVERFFSRAHDELLELLLKKLADLRHDGRRAALLATLIAAVEQKPKVLLPLLERLPVEVREAVKGHLVLSDEEEERLSATSLRDKLLSLEPKRRAQENP